MADDGGSTMVEQHGGEFRERLVLHFGLQQRLELVARFEHGEIDGGFRRSGNRLARSGIMRRNRCRLAESVLFGHGSSLSFRLVIHRAVWVIYER